MTRLFLVLLFGLPCMFSSLAQNSRERMSKANEAFLREQFDSAALHYQKLLKDGWHSADLYYNLGITYFRKNDLASARFNLERARLLSPHDENILYNLEKVKDTVGDYYVFPAYPLFGLVEWIHSTFGRSFVSWFLLLLYLTAGLAFWRWRQSRGNVVKILGLGCLGLFLSMLVIFLFEQTYFRFHGDMAVVGESIVLLEKPDESSTLVRDLDPGYKVRVHEIVGDWATVELADGSFGWLRQDALLPLSGKTEAGG